MTDRAESALGDEAVWHDVECGSYAADLQLWRDLAHEAGGPVLELGCGTGRVALDLAAARHEVVGVDSSPTLLAALRERAAHRELTVETQVADVRALALGRRFSLVCAPMQLIHLLGGAAGRRSMLERARAHLEPRGTLAIAILAEQVDPALEGHPPLPDVRELDGWVYSSQPLDARVADGRITVRRLRQLVSPEGSLREAIEVIELDQLEAGDIEREAAACGLTPRERIEVPPTPDHVGSTVLVLEAS
ncbi:MAG TPA: class I SAM-dependent methyltransferase [Solirubrobacterales bacterium]|nr:class I SAM-dependent methyltransferase [Solirubrobacterales bacterium]